MESSIKQLSILWAEVFARPKFTDVIDSVDFKGMIKTNDVTGQ